jgi:2-methylaconitate cis-trans-isomerase PrpF
VEEGLVQTQTLQTPTSYDPFPHLVRILAANSGKIVLARLQLQLSQDKSGYFVVTEGNTSIAGVPGTSSPIEIENPLDRDPLPTGRVRDFVTVDGKQVSAPASLIFNKDL